MKVNATCWRITLYLAAKQCVRDDTELTLDVLFLDFTDTYVDYPPLNLYRVLVLSTSANWMVYLSYDTLSVTKSLVV